MAVYAVGDIHACQSALNALLETVAFRSGHDRLWFVGDFLNRGPNSLETLRFIKGLGDQAVTVLGNHEGRLIARLSGQKGRQKNPALDALLVELSAAPDAAELEVWLRNIPLFHYDETLDIGMVHAGLSPAWDAGKACELSQVLGKILRDPEKSRVFFQDLDPFFLEKEPSEKGSMNYLRFAFSFMTQIRMCTPEGHPLWPSHPRLASLANPYALPSSSMNATLWPFRPWYDCRPQQETMKTVYGHWAAAGLNLKANVWGLDSGCIYGGQLTAIRLDDPDHPIVQVACKQYVTPEPPS